MLAHPVFADRKRVVRACLSVHYYHKAGSFTSPKLRLFPTDHIWKQTLGMILKDNDKYLLKAADITALATAIDTHLKSGAITALPAGPGYDIDADGVVSLHELVEVLSLIGEGL